MKTSEIAVYVYSRLNLSSFSFSQDIGTRAPFYLCMDSRVMQLEERGFIKEFPNLFRP